MTVKKMLLTELFDEDYEAPQQEIIRWWNRRARALVLRK